VQHYFRVAKHITIALSDELAHKAKVFAAEHNTSVSCYIGALLAERLEAEQGYSKAMEQWMSRTPMVLNESKARYPSRDSLHER
jgi:hypothetical protein